MQVGSGEPVPICGVGPTGALLQHSSGAPVTVGGPAVKPGQGIVLQAGDGPVQVPGGYPAQTGLGQSPQTLTLYGVCFDGSEAVVAYLKHDLPAS